MGSQDGYRESISPTEKEIPATIESIRCGAGGDRKSTSALKGVLRVLLSGCREGQHQTHNDCASWFGHLIRLQATGNLDTILGALIQNDGPPIFPTF